MSTACAQRQCAFACTQWSDRTLHGSSRCARASPFTRASPFSAPAPLVRNGREQTASSMSPMPYIHPPCWPLPRCTSPVNTSCSCVPISTCRHSRANVCCMRSNTPMCSARRRWTISLRMAYGSMRCGSTHCASRIRITASSTTRISTRMGRRPSRHGMASVSPGLASVGFTITTHLMLPACASCCSIICMSNGAARSARRDRRQPIRAIRCPSRRWHPCASASPQRWKLRPCWHNRASMQNPCCCISCTAGAVAPSAGSATWRQPMPVHII